MQGQHADRPARHHGRVGITRHQRSRTAPFPIGFEGRGGFAGDVVAELIQRIADGQLGRDLGDAEAGRLGSQRGGTGLAGVHLDDHKLAVSGIDAELHVRSAGLHTDFAHDGRRARKDNGSQNIFRGQETFSQ